MYAICNVIYGYPMTRGKAVDLVEELEDEAGVITHYSGGSDVTPAAFGVELGRFDEATDYTEMDKLEAMKPTVEQIAKVEQDLSALPAEQQEIIRAEKPRVFILWSTS